MRLFRVDKPHGVALEIPECTIRGKCVTFLNNSNEEVWERLDGPHVTFVKSIEEVAAMMNTNVQGLLCESPQQVPVQQT